MHFHILDLLLKLFLFLNNFLCEYFEFVLINCIDIDNKLFNTKIDLVYRVEYLGNSYQTVESQKDEKRYTNDSSQLVPKDKVDEIFMCIIESSDIKTKGGNDEEEFIEKHDEVALKVFVGHGEEDNQEVRDNSAQQATSQHVGVVLQCC